MSNKKGATKAFYLSPENAERVERVVGKLNVSKIANRMFNEQWSRYVEEEIRQQSKSLAELEASPV